MKYLKNALTAILLLTSFSAHCSSNDDAKPEVVPASVTTSQPCDNQRCLFLERLPYVLPTADQASLRNLIYGYPGNFGNFAEAADLLFFRSRVCSERNIVSFLTILAEQNDPLSFATSCVPFLRNYDNADCCDFIMNTVKKHNNADDTPKSFSEFCFNLVDKYMSIGGEFDQDSLVQVADLLSQSKENTKLAIGYSDLEESQRAAEKARRAADDAKNAADVAKSAADDSKSDANKAKSDVNKAKSDVNKAKNTAEKARSAADDARRAVNITSNNLKMVIVADDARCIAKNIVSSDEDEEADNRLQDAKRAARKAKSAANTTVGRKTRTAESRANIAYVKADDAETAEVAAGVAKRKADDLERDADDARRIAEAKKHDVKLKINSLLVMDLVDKIRPSDRNKVLHFIDKSITDMRSSADDKPVSFFKLLASFVEK